MSARDDYPTLVDFCPHALAEIDRHRAELQLAQGRLNRGRKREHDYAELVKELADECEQLRHRVIGLARVALEIVSLDRTADIDAVIANTPDDVLLLIDPDMVEP